MLRRVAIVSLMLSSLVFAHSAAATDCELCLDSATLQTRDGQAWAAGQPVTLVIHVAANAMVPPPVSAEAVVMQNDGDRTKCLGVPLKLVQSDASGGTYAGLFFPFRPARYDGKLFVGRDVQDITFDMKHMVAGAAPAGELPAAEPIDTAAPVPLLVSMVQLPAVQAGGLAVISLVTLVLPTTRRRGLRTLA
jgi:hypothetical protein